MAPYTCKVRIFDNKQGLLSSNLFFLVEVGVVLDPLIRFHALLVFFIPLIFAIGSRVKEREFFHQSLYVRSLASIQLQATVDKTLILTRVVGLTDLERRRGVQHATATHLSYIVEILALSKLICKDAKAPNRIFIVVICVLSVLCEARRLHDSAQSRTVCLFVSGDTSYEPHLSLRIDKHVPNTYVPMMLDAFIILNILDSLHCHVNHVFAKLLA